MSSPAYTSIPFSYKEDACAQDVVESMEQVGDLASSCLIWAYEIFFRQLSIIKTIMRIIIGPSTAWDR